ncbi:MAG TPA: glycosyltransferase family 39 protein, partial [Candidatus Omnitrophota bacterium]|nr:glycosyltransferase family 39 protein [Candidatus Omnitrophota bacterium]
MILLPNNCGTETFSRNAVSRRIRFVLVILSVLAAFLFVLWKAFFSLDIAFVRNDSKASWIMREVYPSILMGQSGACLFSKSFNLEEPAKTILHAKAMRGFTVSVNGDQVFEKTPAENWKTETRIDISKYLKKGMNTLSFRVSPMGPALLYAYLDGPPERVATDGSWEVAAAGGFSRAVPVNDIRNPSPYRVDIESPVELFKKSRNILGKFFLVFTGFFLMGRLFRRGEKYLVPVVLGGSCILWALFFLKIIKMPLEVGYDVRGHLEYIFLILKNHILPFADQGRAGVPQTYHPPAFYWLSARLLELFQSWRGTGESVLLRIVPFLSGFGNVWIAYFLARELFKSSTGKVFAAAALAAVLPMNFYISAYVSNEGFNGFLSGLSVLIAIMMFGREKTRWGWIPLLGTVLGLALLTKFTAFVLIPVIFFFLAVKLLVFEKAGLAKSFGLLGGLCLVAGLVCGWYYARNIAHFGHPLVGNAEVISSWLFPGFHTPRYYLQFGEVFRNPYFSAYYSFWDGLYSTFWGDGFFGGMSDLRYWNYHFMSIGYLVALPATAFLILGFFDLIRRALRKGPELLGFQ